MDFHKNSDMDQDHQSLAVEVGKANRSATKPRRDFVDFRFWRGQGLSARAAAVVSNAGCQSVDEVRDRGWSFFLRQANCGNRTLQELSDLVGGWRNLPRKRGSWLQHASDEVLIEELRQRGIPAGGNRAS